MTKLSLKPHFIKDSFQVFRQRGFKGLLFGNTTFLNIYYQEILQTIYSNPEQFRRQGGRKGSLVKIDPIHKGKGEVYLLSSPAAPDESVIIFNQNTHITNGPDLWVYLSDSIEPKKNLGNYLNLGMLHGNKGGQAYPIDRSLEQLKQYKSVIIHCKQFDVLFSYSLLC